MSKVVVWLISASCVVLGFFIINGFRAEGTERQIGGVTSSIHIEGLLEQLHELEAEKQTLIESVREKEAEIKNFEDRSILFAQTEEGVLYQISEARVLAGLTDVVGPGVQIILNDRPRGSLGLNNQYDLSSFIVHDTDLLEVVNELRAAGAEAIEINGVRILGSSRISCGGPTINVGRDQRFTPPFVIKAIGDPQMLSEKFREADSVYHLLVFYGLEFSVEILDNLSIARYYGPVELEFATPVMGDM